jgi:ubiquinone/menaquinone biosynthesis C-methylase UbiE
MEKTNKTYFRMMSLMHENLYSIFRNPYQALHAAGLKPGMKVVEFGPGPGFFTIPAAKIVGESGSLHAVDINPYAVKKVSQKVAASGLNNITVLKANAAHTGLPSSSFDLVFMFGFMRPIGNIDDIWAEAYNLLKDDGVLAIEGRLSPPHWLFELNTVNGHIAQYRKASG